MAQNCWTNVCFFSLINYPRISYLQLLAWIISAHLFMSLQCRVGKQPWSNITVQSSQKNSGKWIHHSRSCMKQQPYILLRWTLFDTVMEASQQISCHLPPWHTSQHSRCPSAERAESRVEVIDTRSTQRHVWLTWLTWLSCHGKNATSILWLLWPCLDCLFRLIIGSPLGPSKPISGGCLHR